MRSIDRPPARRSAPHSKNDSLPEGGFWTNGINDDVSSIQMLNP